ncbi:MAG: hypothetical protein JSV45_09350 [Chromatiales bacterium]|nr:MAG: hypothetical protein JSV45_09350 [Chromatiales bacterium]
MTEAKPWTGVINALALTATLVVNGLASGLPLNGQTTGQISNRFDVYFVPASYVFSIWGLIYAALIAFVVYSLLPAHRASAAVGRVGLGFVLSCVANIAWIFCWHYELFELALACMLLMLATLTTVYLRLDVGRAGVSRSERWCVHAPFSLYLGWISVATVANTTQLLDYVAWGRWGIAAETWMLIILAVVVALAAVVAAQRRDLIYLLVLVWALAGIGVKQAAVAVVASGAWVATGLIALLALFALLRPFRSRAA